VASKEEPWRGKVGLSTLLDREEAVDGDLALRGNEGVVVELA
jgi:hypothetical protein